MASKNRIKNIMYAIDDKIALLEGVVLVIGIFAMAINSVANAIGRSLFDHGLFFAEEVNAMLIVLVTFAGISYAKREGRHIRMTAFYDMVPDGPRNILMIVISFTTAAFLFLLTWYAGVYLIDQMNSPRRLPALGIREFWMYIWMPVGLFLCAVQYFLTGLVNIIKDDDVYLSIKHNDSYSDTDEYTEMLDEDVEAENSVVEELNNQEEQPS
ncbi:TRAP transporter small permease [Suttonella sp. R2A3]|uniref:TRAP transporter small permease n=1 Tax=Suttonella sp. R2A3 TaxID=2908648 RepID=UPI001F245B61|nr:TRAP transporter small permease [Suttonella sp. R2A3]UJF23772.1 TRAP transporter small permease [Suttonella sp. R2A3]